MPGLSGRVYQPALHLELYAPGQGSADMPDRRLIRRSVVSVSRLEFRKIFESLDIYPEKASMRAEIPVL